MAAHNKASAFESPTLESANGDSNATPSNAMKSDSAPMPALDGDFVLVPLAHLSNDTDDDYEMIHHVGIDCHTSTSPAIAYDPPSTSRREVPLSTHSLEQHLTKDCIVVELGPRRDYQELRIEVIPPSAELLVQVASRTLPERYVWIPEIDRVMFDRYWHRGECECESWTDMIMLAYTAQVLQNGIVQGEAIAMLYAKAHSVQYRAEHMFARSDVAWTYERTLPGDPLRAAVVQLAVRTKGLVALLGTTQCFLQDVTSLLADMKSVGSALPDPCAILSIGTPVRLPRSTTSGTLDQHELPRLMQHMPPNPAQHVVPNPTQFSLTPAKGGPARPPGRVRFLDQGSAATSIQHEVEDPHPSTVSPTRALSVSPMTHMTTAPHPPATPSSMPSVRPTALQLPHPSGHLQQAPRRARPCAQPSDCCPIANGSHGPGDAQDCKPVDGFATSVASKALSRSSAIAWHSRRRRRVRMSPTFASSNTAGDGPSAYARHSHGSNTPLPPSASTSKTVARVLQHLPESDSARAAATAAAAAPSVAQHGLLEGAPTLEPPAQYGVGNAGHVGAKTDGSYSSGALRKLSAHTKTGRVAAVGSNGRVHPMRQPTLPPTVEELRWGGRSNFAYGRESRSSRDVAPAL